jgi:proteasome-associated ATPase
VRAVANRDDSGRAGRHDDEVKSLTAQIPFLDEEIAALHRRLADSPRQVGPIGERLEETYGLLSGVSARNERLAATPFAARDQIVALKEEADRLALPRSGSGVFLDPYEDDAADVVGGGCKMRVNGPQGPTGNEPRGRGSRVCSDFVPAGLGGTPAGDDSAR